MGPCMRRHYTESVVNQCQVILWTLVKGDRKKNWAEKQDQIGGVWLKGTRGRWMLGGHGRENSYCFSGV